MDNNDTYTRVYRKLGIRVLRYKGHDDLKSKENRRSILLIGCGLMKVGDCGVVRFVTAEGY